MTTRAVRISTFATVITLGALVVSATAGADPQRMPVPAPPSVATSVPNPDRDVAPPFPLCGELDVTAGNKATGYDRCSALCDGYDPGTYQTHARRDMQACDEIGRYMVFGIRIGDNKRSPPSYARALMYFDQSCNPPTPDGNQYLQATTPFWAGCFDLGTLNAKGEGTPVNLPVARGLFVRACGMAVPKITHEACFAAGQMEEAGTGGPQDIAAAIAAYRKACDGGYAPGCKAPFHLQPQIPVPPPVPTGSPTSIPTPPRIPPPPRGTPAPKPRVQ